MAFDINFEPMHNAIVNQSKNVVQGDSGDGDLAHIPTLRAVMLGDLRVSRGQARTLNIKKTQNPWPGGYSSLDNLLPGAIIAQHFCVRREWFDVDATPTLFIKYSADRVYNRMMRTNINIFSILDISQGAPE